MVTLATDTVPARSANQALSHYRNVDELPYHVLQVAKLVGKDDPKAKGWDAVADLLTVWQFLEAKAGAQP